jgi:hypothetical protein
VGLAGSATVLGLGLGAEYYKPGGMSPTLALSVTFAGVGTVLGPLVYLGGWAVRSRHHVEGSLPLRILGWVAYGGMLANVVAIGARGAEGIVPENGLIAFTGALGSLSLALFSAEALLARQQALRAPAPPAARPPAATQSLAGETAAAVPARTAPRIRPLRPRARFAPLLAPVRTPDGGLGGLAGIQGIF